MKIKIDLSILHRNLSLLFTVLRQWKDMRIYSIQRKDMVQMRYRSVSIFKGRVTVLNYKWPTFTVKNRLLRNSSKILPNDT